MLWFVQEQQADLLILIPQKHPFLERVLDTSVTWKILSKPFVPLLALPSWISEKKGAVPNTVINERAGKLDEKPEVESIA